VSHSARSVLPERDSDGVEFVDELRIDPVHPACAVRPNLDDTLLARDIEVAVVERLVERRQTPASIRFQFS
jgi:hypothetical protein